MCVYVEPHGATWAAQHWPESGQTRWHGSASALAAKGLVAIGRARPGDGAAHCSPALSAEGLPLPITRPAHILFGLWVNSGIAMLKVLVGYDKPTWV